MIAKMVVFLDAFQGDKMKCRSNFKKYNGKKDKKRETKF